MASLVVVGIFFIFSVSTDLVRASNVVTLVPGQNLRIIWIDECQATLSIEAYNKTFLFHLNPPGQSSDQETRHNLANRTFCLVHPAEDKDMKELRGIVRTSTRSSGHGRAYFVFLKDESFSGRFVTPDGQVYYVAQLRDDNDLMVMYPRTSRYPRLDDLTPEEEVVHRDRRMVDQDKNVKGHVCEMIVLVDSALYHKMGKHVKDIESLVLRLVDSLSDVKVHTDQGYRGIQFKVVRLVIATDEVCSKPLQRTNLLCRTDQSVYNANVFLRDFSLQDFSDYCLAYLFTAKYFKGTLGVAHVGGLCKDYQTVRYRHVNLRETKSTNTGFITIEDPQLGLDEAEHTLAHEVGHNFGASHDLSSKCKGVLPTLPHLMNPIAPSTTTYSTRRFSRCSLDAINENFNDMERGYTNWCLVPEKPEKTRDGKGGDQVDVQVTTVVINRGDIPEPQPIEGVPLGAILGIVFGSIILALVVLLVVYAFVEQRFCFAPSNPNSDYGKSSSFDSTKVFLRSSISRVLRTRNSNDPYSSRQPPRIVFNEDPTGTNSPRPPARHETSGRSAAPSARSKPVNDPHHFMPVHDHDEEDAKPATDVQRMKELFEEMQKRRIKHT